MSAKIYTSGFYDASSTMGAMSLFTTSTVNSAASTYLYNTAVACVPDLSNTQIVMKNTATSSTGNPSTQNWFNTSAFINRPAIVTRQFMFKESITDTSPLYLHVRKLTSTATSGSIRPTLYSSYSDTSTPTTKTFKFNRFATLFSRFYSQNTKTSNKLSVRVKSLPSENLNIDFILACVDNILPYDSYKSYVDNGPYAYTINIIGSTGIKSVINGSNVCTSYTNTIDKTLLQIDDVIEIVLYRLPNTASFTSTTTSSALFVNLDGLIYKSPDLQISSNLFTDASNSKFGYYGSWNTINFNCNLNSTNIIGDTLSGQWVNLTIKNKTTNASVFTRYLQFDNSNNLLFNFTDNNLLAPGNYEASVSYNPYDSSNNAINSYYLNQPPSTNVNFNASKYLNAPTHYNAGTSNIISFTVKKQVLSVVYDSSLINSSTNSISNSYSILQNINLNGFRLVDLNKSVGSQDVTSEILGTTTMQVNGNSVTSSSINNISFNPLTVTNKLVADSSYNVTASFVPTNTTLFTSASSQPYKLITETPILEFTLDKLTPSYTESVTLTSRLKDSSNNLYSLDVSGSLPGMVNYKIRVNNSDVVITTPIYNSANKTYDSSFSIKDLNLLRYSDVFYTVTSSFTSTSNLVNLSIDVNNFEFNGVELLSLIDSSSVNVYDTVSISASLKDKNSGLKLSASDLPGLMKYQFGVGNYLEQPTQNASKDFVKSFTPNSKGLNNSNSPVDVVVSFIATDSLINTIQNNTLPLQINLINPTYDVYPEVNSDDLYFPETIGVNIHGVSGHNDVGKLQLFNMNNTLINELVNVEINNTTRHEFHNIRLIDLIGDISLSELDSTTPITYNVKWLANTSNIYSTTNYGTFNNFVTKTTCSFTNMDISNNYASVDYPITITGKVSSPYNEVVNGTLQVFEDNSNGTDILLDTIELSHINNTNNFSYDVVSTKAGGLNIYFVFVPFYPNLYNSVTSSFQNINFNKVPVEMVTNVIIDGVSQTPTMHGDINNDLYNISYNSTFKIAVSGLDRIPNSTMRITLLSGAQLENTIYAFPDLSIVSGTASTDEINLLAVQTELNNFSSIVDTPIFIRVEYLDVDTSLYNPYGKGYYLQLYKENVISSNLFSFSLLNEAQLQKTQINFTSQYDVVSLDNLIQTYSLPVNNISVNVLMVVDATTQHRLVDNLTINDESEQILASIIPSAIQLYSGQHQVKFILEQNNPNLNNFASVTKNITVLSDTIDSVGLSFYNNNYSPVENDESIDYTTISYADSFKANVYFYNIGIDGYFEVFCKDPLNILPDQKIGTSSLISSDPSNSDFLSKEFKNVLIDCSAVSFDCTSEITTYTAYVVFKSTSINYSDNTFYSDENSNTFSLSINQASVKISELYVNSVSQTLANDEDKYFPFELNVSQSFQISGKITTTSNIQVTSGNLYVIALAVTNDEGNYGIDSNNIVKLQNNLDSVTIDSNGNFSVSISSSTALLNKLTLSYGSIQICYVNSKNYFSTNFSNNETDTCPGVLSLSYLIPSTNMSLTTQASKVVPTNLNSYYYQEDLIVFEINFTELFSSVKDGIIYLNIENKNGVPIHAPYPLTLIEKPVTLNAYATLSINPKTENIPFNEIDGYKCYVWYNQEGVYSPSFSNELTVKVLKTIPRLDIVYRDLSNNSTSAVVNYESSIDMEITVKTKYSIAAGVNQTRDIEGSLKFNKDGALLKLAPYVNGVLSSDVSSNITFSNNNINSSTGIRVKYTPKNNAPGTLYYNGLVPTFTPTNSSYVSKIDADYFDEAKTMINFRITQYRLKMSIESISVYNDVTHSTPNSNNVDEEGTSIYYENDSSGVLFNGVINLDEKFKVVINFEKNVAFNRFVLVSLVNPPSTADGFSLSYPESYTVTDNSSNSFTFVGIFPGGQISLPRTNNSNTLYMYAQVYASNIEYYTYSETPVVPYNIYEYNKFGKGYLFFDTLNNVVATKTISYKSTETYNVYTKFDFDTSIPVANRKCWVDLYYDNFNSSNKISTTSLELLDSSNNGFFTINKTRLPYINGSYSLKALFTPYEVKNGTKIRNRDYPVIAKEYFPLTLRIKPTLTIVNGDFYSYARGMVHGSSVPLTIKINSGTANIGPYSRLIVQTTGLNVNYSNISYYDFSYSVIDPSFTFNFGEYVYGGASGFDNATLLSGELSTTILLTDASSANISFPNISADPLTFAFNVNKRGTVLSVTPLDSFILYRNPLSFNITLGNYPIDNGKINFIMVNKETNYINNFSVTSSQLVPVSGQPNVYNYTVSDESTVLKDAGGFYLNATLDNRHYSSNEFGLNGSGILVSKNTNCSIVLDSYSYSQIYGSLVNLTSRILYNEVENITDASLQYIVNGGVVQNAIYDASLNKYKFQLDTTTLNKGNNEGVIFFSHKNYLASPQFFEIYVEKQSDSSNNFTLSHDALLNTQTTFTLNLTGVNSATDSVSFYKQSALTHLTQVDVSGSSYKFNFSELIYGSNKIYAVIRNINYDVTSTFVDVIRTRKDASVNLTSPVLSSDYKSGSNISMTYTVSESLNPSVLVKEGVVEFHKETVDKVDNTTVLKDEIVGIVNVNITSGQSVLSSYKLLHDASENPIRFYGMFKKSQNFNNNVLSEKSALINVYPKYNIEMIDNSNFLDNSSVKLGETVQLNYIVTKSLAANNTLVQSESTYADKISLYNQAVQVYNSKVQAETAAETALLAATAIKNTERSQMLTAEGIKNSALTAKNNALTARDNALVARDNALAAKNSAQLDLSAAELNVSQITDALNASNLALSQLNDASGALLLAVNAHRDASGVLVSAINERDIALGVRNSAQDALNSAQADLSAAWVILDASRNDLQTAETELIDASGAQVAAVVARDTAITERDDAISALNIAHADLSNAVVARDIALDNLLAAQMDVSSALVVRDNAVIERDGAIVERNTTRDEIDSSLSLVQMDLSSAIVARDLALDEFNTAQVDLSASIVTLSNATSEYNTALAEFNNIEGIISQALIDLSNAFISQAAALSELDTAQFDLSAAIVSLDNAQSQVNTAQSEVNSLQGELDVAQVDLSASIVEKDAAEYQLDSALSELDTASRNLDFIVNQMTDASNNGDTETYNELLPTKEQYQTTYNDKLAAKNQKQTSYNEKLQLYNEKQTAYNTKSTDLSTASGNLSTKDALLSNQQGEYNSKLDIRNSKKSSYDTITNSILSLAETVTSQQDALILQQETVNVANANVNTEQGYYDSYLSVKDAKQENYSEKLALYNNAQNDYNTVISPLIAKENIILSKESVLSEKQEIYDTKITTVNELQTTLNTKEGLVSSAADFVDTKEADLDAKEADLDAKEEDLVAKINAYNSKVLARNTIYDLTQGAYDIKHAIYDLSASYLNEKQGILNEKEGVVIEKQTDYNTKSTTLSTRQSEYTSSVTNYQTKKADYDTKKADYDTTKANYDTKLADYNTKVTDYNTKSTDYSNKESDYQTKQATYDRENTEYINANTAYENANQFEVQQESFRITASEEKNTANTNMQTALANMNTALTNAVVTEGVVEFHKVIIENNVDEIIGYIVPDNKGFVSLQHKLVDVSGVGFYSVFKNAINYNNKETPLRNVNVFKQIETDITTTTSPSLCKIGDFIDIQYTVKVSGTTTLVNEGFVELRKHVVKDGLESVDLLGYVTLTSTGLASFRHEIVDIGSISFTGHFMNSINYANSDSSSLVFTSVKEYNSVTTNNYTLNDIYKLGQTITLQYKVNKELDPSFNINEGIVEIHKVVTGTAVDESIAFIRPVNNAVSFTYKVVNTTGEIGFYAVYKNTSNYADSSSTTLKTNIVKQYSTTVLNNSVLQPSYKLGQSITLQYNVRSDSVPLNNIGLVEIHKVSITNDIIGNIVPDSSGNVSLNYTLVELGSVKFYAVFTNSVDYESKTGDEQSTNVYAKFDASMIDLSEVNNSSSYKLGSVIRLKYKLKKLDNTPLNEGTVEFIKRNNVTNLSEIIRYANVDSNGEVTVDYTLSQLGSVSFYANFMDSLNYSNVSTLETPKTINVFKRLQSVLVDTSSLSSRIILGGLVHLTYTVKNSQNVGISEGVIEVHKKIKNTSVDEILCYLLPNSLGVVAFNYTLTMPKTQDNINESEVEFYAVYNSSMNYDDSTTILDKKSVTVYRQDTPVVTDYSSLGVSYKLGNQITLSYNVVNVYGTRISDGAIEFHMVKDGVDEILHATILDVSGNASFNLKLVNLGVVTFYGLFKNSAKYANLKSSERNITVTEQYDTVSSLTTSVSSLAYGDNVQLNAQVSVSSNNVLTSGDTNVISDGVVEYYVTINSVKELIGFSSVTNGSSSLTYTVNDVGTVYFTSIFKNSIKYAESNTNLSPVNVTVSKRSPASITIATPTDAFYLKLTTITANISLNKEDANSSQGTVTFAITNNSVTSYKTAAVNSNSSFVRLLLTNSTDYVVTATFNGNDNFGTVVSQPITISPTVTSNLYSSLTYTTAFLRTAMDAGGGVKATARVNFASDVSNNYILKNTGYVIFVEKNNGTIIDEVVVPLVNGTAVATVITTGYFTPNYRFEVYYKDRLVNPNITLTGTLQA